MRLNEYIEQVGDEAFARQFRIKLRTVKSWRLGDRRPRAEQARRIVAKTPVTYEGIYGPMQSRAA